MNAPAPELAAFQSYVDKWLEDAPEARLLRVFLPAARTPAYEAHACLEHELLFAACRVREREPALAKLAWWQEELRLACDGHARHPLTRRLHALGALGATQARAADALLAGASGIAVLESPQDVEVLLAPFAAFARASRLLRAEARPEECAPGAPGAALLVDALRHWPSFAEPQRARVPLSMLARAGATREEAARGAAGAAVLDSLCAAIEPELVRIPGEPEAGGRAICAAHVLRAIRRDPEACLVVPPRIRSVPLLLDLWRHARRVA